MPYQILGHSMKLLKCCWCCFFFVCFMSMWNLSQECNSSSHQFILDTNRWINSWSLRPWRLPHIFNKPVARDTYQSCLAHHCECQSLRPTDIEFAASPNLLEKSDENYLLQEWHKCHRHMQTKLIILDMGRTAYDSRYVCPGQ